MKTAGGKTISETGFTLLELLVVGVLIALVLTISIPNVQSLLFSDPLRKSARLVAATLAEARERAMGSEHGVVVMVDVSGGNLQIEPQSRRSGRSGAEPADSYRVQVPSPVLIDSVWTRSSGPISGAKAPIFINRRGMIEPVLINLSEAARAMAVKGAPFSGGIEVFDQKLSPDSPAAALPVSTR